MNLQARIEAFTKLGSFLKKDILTTNEKDLIKVNMRDYQEVAVAITKHK